MNVKDTAIDVIRRMPDSIDYDDLVKLLADELYAMEMKAFGIDPDSALFPAANVGVDNRANGVAWPGRVATHDAR